MILIFQNLAFLKKKNIYCILFVPALLGNETCSPILNSDRHNRVGDRDFQLAGPSGFSQPSRPTHNLFVASTPAFNVNKPSGKSTILLFIANYFFTGPWALHKRLFT